MNLFSAFLLLGIIDDIFNFGTSWFKDDEQGTSLALRETASSSFFVPGAVSAPVAPVIPIIGGIIIRKGVQQLSKSAIKAAKKKAKNQARVSGKQRNKTRHQPGGSGILDVRFVSPKKSNFHLSIERNVHFLWFADWFKN